MKVLMIGDVVAEAGVEALKTGLPKLQKKHGIDFTVVNVENMADGRGFNKKSLQEIEDLEIDVMTLGNHTFSKMDIYRVLGEKKLLRPANYPKGVPGKGYKVYEKNGLKIAVISLLGRVSMGILTENPFIVGENAINKLSSIADLIIIDFHGEATAEKLAFAKYFDGRSNIIVGTHTHVQTADETILPKGTGYITDLGMTGTLDRSTWNEKRSGI